MSLFASLSPRAVLAVDAATCAVMGVGLLAAARPVADLTQLPAGLLFWAGAALLPVAAFMALVAAPARTSRAGLALIVAGNAAWALASLVVLAATTPNALGVAFVLGQAGAVALLTIVEAGGLRAARPAAQPA